MDLGPEEFLIYETYFEDNNNVNRNEGCCSTLIVLAVIFIIVNVLIVKNYKLKQQNNLKIKVKK